MNLMIILHLVVVYTPFLQPFFHTIPIGLFDWVIILVVASVLIIIDEARTFIASRYPRFRKIAGYW